MPSRREALAGLASVVALSGCVGRSGGDEPTASTTTTTPGTGYRPGPFVLWNRDDAEHEVRLSVRGADGTEVFEGAWTLAPGESKDVEAGPVPAGEYRFVARVDDYETTHEYTVDECAPDEYFQVLVESDGRPAFRRLRETSDPSRC